MLTCCWVKFVRKELRILFFTRFCCICVGNVLMLYAMPLKAPREALGRTLQDVLKNQFGRSQFRTWRFFDRLFLSFHGNLKKMKCRPVLRNHVHTLQKICLKIKARTQIEGDTYIEFAESLLRLHSDDK